MDHDESQQRSKSDHRIPYEACADGKRLRLLLRSTTSADPMCRVLDGEDLLIEILVRLGFPTVLVRASLVCKRWYRHASDPVFLRRFRRLHPSRLFGLYIETRGSLKPPRFVPVLPQPRELDSVFSRASFGVENCVMGCRNGVVATSLYNHQTQSTTYASRYPLCPQRGKVSLPPLPRHQVQDGNVMVFSELLLKEKGASASYLCVMVESTKEKTKSMVHVYTLQDGVWCIYASVTTDLPCHKAKLVGNRIYMRSSPQDISVFDLTDLRFSTLHLPEGMVAHGKRKRTIMSPADDDDSGVYFVKFDELQLSIWLHKGGKRCELVDTILLREMFADLIMSDDKLTEKHLTRLQLSLVGDNAEFVIFRIGSHIFHLDIKRRTLRKVHKMAGNDFLLRSMHLFMMIWPPTFPTLKHDPIRDAT